MSSDKFFVFLGKIVLVLVVVAVVAFGAFYLGTKNSQKQPVQSSSQNQSYAQPSIIPSAVTPTGISTPVPTIDEAVVLKVAIKNALVAEHGSDASALTITVSKIEGDYASGDASAQGGGGMWFAAKVNGVWKLVWDGNGSIQCSSVAPYPNFPTDILPQCWDDKTQAVVTR
jgi:hypothetical protein